MSNHDIIDAREKPKNKQKPCIMESGQDMYKRKSPQISFFDDPALFFTGARFDSNNRWIKLARMIPWNIVEEKYAKQFKSTPFSRPAKPARMAIGCLIIKDKFGLSDVQTIEMIAENPYMQYFVGLTSFTNKAPIEASLLTWFRKRITADTLAQINDYIIGRKIIEHSKSKDDKDEPKDESRSYGETGGDSDAGSDTNNGTLILDATCVPSDIRFPTDVSLLNEGRECLEGIIDELHEQGNTNGVKPRTYREVARKEFLRFVRNRKPSRKLIRRTIRKQLGYMHRDLTAIDACDITNLSEKNLQRLGVARKLYKQQHEMYENKTHKTEDRIVSIQQPWVRPIVRGKATADVEFGAKVSISVLNGYSRIERLSWDAYNESKTLKDTVERYREQTGVYPNRILADKIYRTRENLQYCSEHKIHMNGPKLGRPPMDKTIYAQQCADERKESGERNIVEGTFGTGKRCYSLDRLSARLQATCETQIHLAFLTMNLWKRLKSLLRQITGAPEYVFLYFKRVRISNRPCFGM